MGIVINGGFAQMMDLMAGFMGFDPAGDDGYKYGRWPWQTTRRMVRRDTGIEGAAPTREPARPEAKPEPKPKVEETPKPKTESKVRTGRSTVATGTTQGLVRDRDLTVQQ